MKKIVWLGPMGSDEISKRAIEIAQFYLDPTCKEFGFTFYFPQVLGADNWLTALLDEIRSASGLICDISGERCNVYFELGFAHALKVPTIILCRSGTDVHIDLKNIQHHVYTTIPDIQPVVKKWLAQLTANREALSSVTRKLPHPFQIIEGDGYLEYVYNPRLHRRPFEIKETDSALTLETISQTQPEVGVLLTQIHDIQEEISRRTFRPFFPGSLLGFINYVPRRDASGTLFGAHIGVRRTDYHVFAATHYPVQAVHQARELGLIDDEVASSLLDQITTRMKSPSWPFARPLTVMLFLILNVNGTQTVLFQRRNTAKNFHAMYSIQATAGGMIHPSQILNYQSPSEASPEMAFVQELCEETGIRVPVERVRILGLIREEQWNELAFVGYVADEPELDGRKLPIDSFESDAFESVPLQPAFMKEFLRSKANRGKDLTPLTLGALALLLTHEYGVQLMEQIFTDAAL